MAEKAMSQEAVQEYISQHPETVQQFLQENEDFAFNWFVKNASKTMVTAWSLENPKGDEVRQEKGAVVEDGPRNSITTDIFKSYVEGRRPTARVSMRDAVERLKKKGEEDLFMDLIMDISHELDVNLVCHKILTNVSLLTSSDRGSLFLARGPKENRYLRARLFDVMQDSTLEDSLLAEEEQFKIPFGVGLVGHVAKTKECINIKEAYEDPRFNKAIDLRTGYRTHSVLCMPILNYEGEVIGVAQIINKTTGSHEFTAHDEQIFRRYLVFCGIGLTNAQLFEMSVGEFKRNQLLLSLAKSIFEEQTNLDKVVHKIMKQAKALLTCRRCTVYLVDKATDQAQIMHLVKRDVVAARHLDVQSIPKLPSPGLSPLPRHMAFNFNDSKREEEDADQPISFLTVFDLRDDDEEIRTLNDRDIENWRNAGIAKHVAKTAEILNIADLETDEQFGFSQEEEPGGFRTTSVLCMPIFNSDRSIIGVAQLSNKNNNMPFDDADTNIFETFAIFCGLGIHNTQMYESACKLMAKQTVALEVLSYHATAPQEEAEKLMAEPMPSAREINLYSFDFSDFPLSDDKTVQATVKMFLEIEAPSHHKIPVLVLTRWVLSVRKNYRPVTYHNWRHAFNVAQSMFTMIYTGGMKKYMTDLEVFLLLVACLSHDLDHRGTNNTFQLKVESPLARLYSTSTMEHHHFDHCIMILNSEGNNILQSFAPEEYRKAIRILEAAILSTDLALYFKKRGNFQKLVESGERNWVGEDKKELLRGMMMTACDVAAITKPWDVQKEVAKLVASEFFEQGDLEKTQLHEQPIAMMDREKKDDLPKMQVGFIDAICTPVYKAFADLEQGLRPLFEGCQHNKQQWQMLADNPDDEAERSNSPVRPERISLTNGDKPEVERVRKSSIEPKRKESNSLKPTPTGLENGERKISNGSHNGSIHHRASTPAEKNTDRQTSQPSKKRSICLGSSPSGKSKTCVIL